MLSVLATAVFRKKNKHMPKTAINVHALTFANSVQVVISTKNIISFGVYYFNFNSEAT